MPTGILNFVLAALILNLKAILLPRIRALPCFTLYIAASCVTTSCYLLGWDQLRIAWDAPVAVLGALAAVEASTRVFLESRVGALSQLHIYRWCLGLAMVLSMTAWIADPLPYPGYPHITYYLRLYVGIFSIGWLAGTLHYSSGEMIGVRVFMGHAALLLLRIAAETGPLVIYDRSQWFQVDAWSKAGSLLTLCGWLLINKRNPGRIVHSRSTFE